MDNYLVARISQDCFQDYFQLGAKGVRTDRHHNPCSKNLAERDMILNARANAMKLGTSKQPHRRCNRDRA